MKYVMLDVSKFTTEERIMLRFGTADEKQRVLAKKKFAEKPFATSGNRKLGKGVASFSKPYSNGVVSSDTYGSILGSCGEICAVCGCANECYVRHSYWQPSVRDNHVRNEIVFRDDIDWAFEKMAEYLRRKKKPFAIVRIDQSGEIETEEELIHWINLAYQFSVTDFYVYTKNFKVLDAVLEKYGLNLPKNFTILISIWHESGIGVFKRWCHLPNIKAFVYDDGFDYEAHGIHIETWCMAYDKKGHMNHAITCDICKKCFSGVWKVIGCYPH